MKTLDMDMKKTFKKYLFPVFCPRYNDGSSGFLEKSAVSEGTEVWEWTLLEAFTLLLDNPLTT